MAGGVSGNWSTEVLHRRLLLGLERARTRLAVAIACERKATLPESWRVYRETDDRVRRCLKELRLHHDRTVATGEPWFSALAALDRVLGASEPYPLSGQAQRLSRHLSEVLELIEATHSECDKKGK